MSQQKIRRALISVTNKDKLVELAKTLHEMGIEIVSTGGTMGKISEAGIPVIEISKFTGSPEVMDGRVKTLHPKVHGGILYRRDNDQDIADLITLDGRPIDLVVVNLYEFEKTVENPDTTDDEIIENIDIGGPSMLRSAAKNFKFTTVVSDPGDYDQLIEQLKDNKGCTTLEFRRSCAKAAFAMTADYDTAIADYFVLGKPDPDGTE